MCMFTGPVEQVESTKIFARKTAPDRQLVIYEMQVSAPTEVAMVLPVPIVPGGGKAALRFIALDHAHSFFDDLETLFEPPLLSSRARGHDSAGILEVHTVGAFEASFVPQIADFARLDPRFRMPSGTLERMPAYADWGFAVFQLARTHAATRVHPMGFEFHTRVPDRLFFPTLHLHDGVMHEYAEFSHFLYAQDAALDAPPTDDERDPWHAPFATFEDCRLPGATTALVDTTASIARCPVFGWRRNQDAWATLQRR